jgi:hypothetical protein
MHDSNLKSPHSLGTLGLFFTPLVLAGERFCGRIRGTDGLKRSQSSARWDRSAQMLRDKHSILSVSQWREERGSGIKPLFGCGLFPDSQPLLDPASVTCLELSESRVSAERNSSDRVEVESVGKDHSQRLYLHYRGSVYCTEQELGTFYMRSS